MSNDFYQIKAVLSKANIPTNNLRISFLNRGLTNKNYKVITDKHTLHVRLACANSIELGIIRKNEASMLTYLAQYGFVPKIYFMDQQGNLVSQFINGVHPAANAMIHHENFRAASNILKTIHGSENNDLTPKCIFRCVKQDHIKLVESKMPLPKPYSLAITNFCLLKQNGYEIGNCHGDLLLNNVLVDTTGQLYFLDWEYTGRTQIMYDLASWALSCQMNEMQANFFLQFYFDKVTQQIKQQMKDMMFICLLREAQWSLLQSTMHIEEQKYLERAERYLSKLNQEFNLLTQT